MQLVVFTKDAASVRMLTHGGSVSILSRHAWSPTGARNIDYCAFTKSTAGAAEVESEFNVTPPALATRFRPSEK
jgi:hypothetical protein